MAASEHPGAAATSTTAERAAAPRRERTFQTVLLGLVLLVLGFTATLVANAFYPCEPAAGSIVQPPLTDCAVSLSPWIGLAAIGLLLAAVGYYRVG